MRFWTVPLPGSPANGSPMQSRKLTTAVLWTELAKTIRPPNKGLRRRVHCGHIRPEAEQFRYMLEKQRLQ
jgi:hypothetical protein